MASIARFDEWQNTLGNRVNTVVQVASVYNADRQSFAAQDLTGISGLSITFTPKYVGSKILLLGMISGTNTHVNSYGILKNSVAIGGPGNNNVPSGSLVTVYKGDNNQDYITTVPINFLDTATTTSATTYQLAVSSSWGGTLYTTWVNDRSGNDMRASSSLIILEIAQ